MFKFNNILKLLTAVFLTVLVACSHQDKVDAPEPVSISGFALSLDQEVQGLSDIEWLDDKTLILSSETQGLSTWLLDQDKRSLTMQSKIEGEFEHIDLLWFAEKHWLAASNAKTNSIDIFESKDYSISSSLSVNDFIVESFCFSQINQHHSIYMLDGDGTVQQYALNEKDKLLAEPVLIREFYVGPDTNICLSNTNHENIWFSEAAVGLWKYFSDAEFGLSRQLSAFSPYSTIPQNISKVDWLNPESEILLALVEESNRLLSVSLTGNKPNIKAFVLNQEQTLEAERFAIIANQLALINQADGKVYLFDSPFEKQTAKPTDVKQSLFEVPSWVQTDAMQQGGDAADDPAIWINPTKPAASLIYATNKKRGLRVYNLQGELVQSIDNGHINNIDIRYNFRLGKYTFDLAVASNRSQDTLSIYTINQQSGLATLHAEIASGLSDTYGLCMGEKSVWLNDKAGLFQEFALSLTTSATGDESIQATAARSFSLASQPEGCVVDDARNIMFAGEENEGVWLVDLSQDSLSPEMIYSIKQHEQLVADVEGLAIAKKGYQDKDVLVISSQGDNSYVLASTQSPYQILGKFRIGLNLQKGIDGASETDGLDVTTHNLGGDFATGMLVVQDGHNLMPVKPQNFKLLPWQAVVDGLTKIQTSPNMH